MVVGKRASQIKCESSKEKNSRIIHLLALPNGNKIIIDNTATSKPIIESSGKLVLNKAGN